MNLKNKGLDDSAGGTQSKFMGFQSLHNSFVEVSDESCHKQEYSILCHERFWQSIPAKAIVHVIEDAFLATTKIVGIPRCLFPTRLVIVSQYTSVGIFLPKCQGLPLFRLCLCMTRRYGFSVSISQQG